MRNLFVQGVLDEIDILQLISEDVPLENDKVKCPFDDHLDNNPSFAIYPATQSFFCFGCRRGGTAIDYIMHRDNVTPGEAIRILCERCNIPLQEWSDEEKKAWEKEQKEKPIVLEIHANAAKYTMAG